MREAALITLLHGVFRLYSFHSVALNGFFHESFRVLSLEGAFPIQQQQLLLLLTVAHLFVLMLNALAVYHPIPLPAHK